MPLDTPPGATLEGVSSPAVVRASSLERDPLKKDFRNFMWKVWMTLFGNPPTELMYELGERLQFGPAKDVLMGYRGLAKSYITVVFGVAALYSDPTEIVLTVSGSEKGAKGNADLAWSMINGFDWLSHMKPTGMLRQSSQAFDVSGSRMEKSESFAAMSLFGQITGRRSSLIIPDDVETPNTSATEGDRSLLRLRYAELGGAILKPKGRIKVLGTAQHEQTIYLELVNDKGYGMRMWPVVYPLISTDPKKDEIHKYGPWLAPSIRAAVEANPELAGTTVEPTRFDAADLFDRRLEYGNTEFERQFKLWLDAGVGVEQPLRLRDCPVIEISPPSGPTKRVLVPANLTWSPLPANRLEDIQVDSLSGDGHVYAASGVDFWQEAELVQMTVDPSGGGKDETAWGVEAQHLGRVFSCMWDARLEGFSKSTMEAIAADAKLWGCDKIRIEKNYGGGMFGELLRPYLLAIGHPCAIEEENAGQVQKEVRIIDSLEAMWTSHRIVFNAEALRKDFRIEYPQVEEAKRRFYRMTYQATRLTKKKGCVAHDDRIDRLASAVSGFMGTLRRQVEDAAKESREAYLMEAAEKLIESRRKQGLSLFGLEPPTGHLINFLGKSQSGLRGSPLFQGRKL